MTSPVVEDEQSTEYTVFAVYQRAGAITDADVSGEDAAARLHQCVDSIADNGVTLRGLYDVSGLRADADAMIWLHGARPEALQQALRALRWDTFFGALTPVWNAMGVHRTAEFNRAHIPGFLRGERPRDWLTVYPFVRSYEWYLLPTAERSAMLADHGRKGAAFRSVVANTVAAFALGDYEWLLPMESDHLTDLVDLMRDLRDTEARRHVREEVPFYTGRRVSPAELVEALW